MLILRTHQPRVQLAIAARRIKQNKQRYGPQYVNVVAHEMKGFTRNQAFGPWVHTAQYRGEFQCHMHGGIGSWLRFHPPLAKVPRVRHVNMTLEHENI